MISQNKGKICNLFLHKAIILLKHCMVITFSFVSKLVFLDRSVWQYVDM